MAILALMPRKNVQASLQYLYADKTLEYLCTWWNPSNVATTFKPQAVLFHQVVIIDFLQR